jgi:N-acetylmuramoyl-L-alanine amidase
MSKMTPESIIERYGRAKERRASWEAHWQFSCWNERDPNRTKIESVVPSNKAFISCLRIARRALNGTLKDPTCGATHYHVKGIFPPWARGRAPSAEIGAHQFYNNVE